MWRSFVRMIPAIAFVPVEDVVKVFTIFKDSQIYNDNESLLAERVAYFEDTWIGKLHRSSVCVPPRFALSS